ncbi:MAG: hypothetical protein ACPGUF_03235 [Litorivicinus sp.]
MYLPTPRLTLTDDTPTLAPGAIARVFVRKNADDHFLIGEIVDVQEDVIRLLALALYKHGRPVPMKPFLNTLATPAPGYLPAHDAFRRARARPGRIQIMTLCDSENGLPSPPLVAPTSTDVTGADLIRLMDRVQRRHTVWVNADGTSWLNDRPELLGPFFDLYSQVVGDSRP